MIKNLEYKATSQFIFRFNDIHIKWVKKFVSRQNNEKYLFTLRNIYKKFIEEFEINSLILKMSKFR